MMKLTKEDIESMQQAEKEIAAHFKEENRKKNPAQYSTILCRFYKFIELMYHDLEV